MIVVAETTNDFDTETCPTWLNHIVHIASLIAERKQAGNNVKGRTCLNE